MVDEKTIQHRVRATGSRYSWPTKRHFWELAELPAPPKPAPTRASGWGFFCVHRLLGHESPTNSFVFPGKRTACEA
ncbi:hypothetical protein R70199_07478 [Paraburkholderia domus]|nr:hypothetical protein R70199_07478 [Paraburkholderia domus]